MGHALGQTLFTSLYIDKILAPRPLRLHTISFSKLDAPADTLGHQLVEKVIKPFCLGIVKCCGLVYQQIGPDHLYEFRFLALTTDFTSH